MLGITRGYLIQNRKCNTIIVVVGNTIS